MEGPAARFSFPLPSLVSVIFLLRTHLALWLILLPILAPRSISLRSNIGERQFDETVDPWIASFAPWCSLQRSFPRVRNRSKVQIARCASWQEEELPSLSKTTCSFSKWVNLPCIGFLVPRCHFKVVIDGQKESNCAMGVIGF